MRIKTEEEGSERCSEGQGSWPDLHEHAKGDIKRDIQIQ